jgi:hypothetical protein
VILEADEFERRAGRLGSNDGVPNEAPRSGDGNSVEDADARKHIAGAKPERVAKQLVCTAYRQHDGSILDCVTQRATGVTLEVPTYRDLVPVLATAGEDQVELVERTGAADAPLDDLDRNSPPATALNEGDDVSTIAIDVHSRRVQITEVEAQHVAHSAQYWPA